MLPALLLGLMLLLAFDGAIEGRRFYLRDISQNHHPLRALVTERLRAGSLPLWDPYHGGGTPLLANPNALTLHPITMLFFVLPFEVAFSASIVLQFLLLAAGGYLLARALRLEREAACLVGAILSVSGPAASLASMQNVLCAAAWVPLALWAFLRGLRQGRRWLLALAAFSTAVVLMTGEPASLLGLVLLGLALAATEPAPSSHRPLNRKACVWLLIVVGLAAVVAASQWVPALALLPLSERGAGFGMAEGMKWSLLPQRLIELLIPRLFGDPTRLSPISWWGGFLFEGHYPFLLSLYLGAIPCLLACIGVWHRGPGLVRRRVLGVIAALSLLGALGRDSVLYRSLFGVLAPLRQIRYPERFVLIFLFAVAILAGYGLQRLIDSPPTRRLLIGLCGGASALFLLCTLGAVASSADWLLRGIAAIPSAFLATEGGAMVRAAVLRSELWAFGESALLLGLGLYALRRPQLGRVRVVALAIVALSALSMLMASSPARSTAAPGWLEAASPLASAVHHGSGGARLHHEPRPSDLSVWAKTDELVWGYRFDRFEYALMTGHPEGVPTALDAATDRMDLKEGPELGRALRALPLEARVRALAASRVGTLLSYEKLEDPGLLETATLDGLSQPSARLYRVRGTVPRLRFVSRARALPEAGAAAGLSDPAYDPMTAVLLEPSSLALGTAADQGAETESAAAAEMEILQETSERILIRVRAQHPGYLVLADAYAPGWRATIDDRAAPILKADGLFRALAVSPGDHRIEMVYRPASIVVGLFVGGLGLLFLSGFGLVAAGKRL